MEFKASFGEYITKEYGLLSQILSYLQPSDLQNAKLVCQDWNHAVSCLTDRNPFMLIQEENIIPFNPKRKPVLPTVVLFQKPSKKLSDKNFMGCNKCDEPFFTGLCPCSICGPDTLYISVRSPFRSSSLNKPPSPYGFSSQFMCFMLPSSDQIQVSIFHSDSRNPIFKKEITDEVINQYTGGSEPIKCVLLLTKTQNKGLPWVNILLNEIARRQEKKFAVGGGKLVEFQHLTQGTGWEDSDVVVITLRGDGVDAHSDLLSAESSTKMEQFMSDLSERMGPVPEGGSRMSFVTQCVDRTSLVLEWREASAFRKHFPNVPLFGMVAYGEYGISHEALLENAASKSEPEPKRRKTKMPYDFDHFYTSSFLFLTFSKV